VTPCDSFLKWVVSGCCGATENIHNHMQDLVREEEYYIYIYIYIYIFIHTQYIKSIDIPSSNFVMSPPYCICKLTRHATHGKNDFEYMSNERCGRTVNCLFCFCLLHRRNQTRVHSSNSGMEALQTHQLHQAELRSAQQGTATGNTKNDV
jgi:hypothetical protein